MAKLSPDIRANLSPDLLHPCLIDESDWSDEMLHSNRASALASLVVIVPLLGVAIVTVALLEKWRAWRARE